MAKKDIPLTSVALVKEVCRRIRLNSPPLKKMGDSKLMLLRGLEDPLRNAYDII